MGSRSFLFSLLEQLGCELVEVLLPVDPGVAAGSLLEGRSETVLFEQLDGLTGPGQQEVLLAGGEPQELQPLPGVGFVEPLRVVLLPVLGLAEDDPGAE